MLSTQVVMAKSTAITAQPVAVEVREVAGIAG
jgi:hypothetical protein